MASITGLSRNPFQALESSLVSIATGLHAESSDVLDLTPLVVGKNALGLVKRTLPALSVVISTIGPS